MRKLVVQPNNCFSDSDLTVKGRKCKLVESLIVKLNCNKEEENALLKEQKNIGKLSKSDQERLEKVQVIVARLDKIIAEQIKMFHLNYRKTTTGSYCYYRQGR